jgi:glycosyltransferase involved in cell wall biosynthesis
MSSLPLVSIITPLYNHAQYIEEGLNSILAEWEMHYPEIEVVMIDDGSKDNSFETAQLWRQKHPNAFRRFYLMRQTNAGLCRTLNRLVAMSEGKYITQLQSDDCHLPQSISKRVEALESHSQWLAAFGDCHLINEQSQLVHTSGLEFAGRLRKIMYSPLLARDQIVNVGIPFQFMMVKKEAYAIPDVGLYDESLIYEDRYLATRLLAKPDRFGFVDHACVAYRIRSEHTYAWPYRPADLHTAKSDYKNASLYSGLNRIALLINAKYNSVRNFTSAADGTPIFNQTPMHRATHLVWQVIVRYHRWACKQWQAKAVQTTVGAHSQT